MPRQKPSGYSNYIASPIYPVAAYSFRDTAEIVDYHEGRSRQGRYGRYDNLNWVEVESKLAELDECEESLVFASGMNAITTSILSLVQSGDRVLFTGNGYRNTLKFFGELLPRTGVECVDISSRSDELLKAQIDEACTSNTRVVFVEMPANPCLYMADLEWIRDRIPEDVVLIVDSSFASPVNLKPSRFGADLVIHSCTKYMGGHADLMMGSVAGSSRRIEQVRGYRNVLGGIADGHSAFLFNRSLATLELRMRHLNAAGMRLARFLEEHPRVRRVYYTGLESHPQFELAKTCLTGHGSVVSFEVDASGEATSRFVDALQVPYMGSNFGSQFSMVEQCSIFTYYQTSAAEKERLGISDSLIRFSLGLEDEDLVRDDLARALDSLPGTERTAALKRTDALEESAGRLVVVHGAP